ncbi:response regulator transcription factor [Piscinibacter gummiphilus]|uniref:response regulator transcription factor n=1 Tax=Piscinibacter gummiphilus TaxID=946333 RepID=UPI0039B96D26
MRKDASHIELSCREVEIARHVASGRPSRAIATSLGLGVRTVESHRRTIKRKLGVASNAELVRYAIENLPGL